MHPPAWWSIHVFLFFFLSSPLIILLNLKGAFQRGSKDGTSCVWHVELTILKTLFWSTHQIAQAKRGMVKQAQASTVHHELSMKHLTGLVAFERKRNLKEHKEGRQNCRQHLHTFGTQHYSQSTKKRRGPLVTEQDNERLAQASLSENLAGVGFPKPQRLIPLPLTVNSVW